MEDVKLYTVASTVAEYDGHKDVVFNWFVNRCREPVYPFTEVVPEGFRLPEALAGVLVNLPDAYTSDSYWYSEDALNQMFALEEAEMLAEYLRGYYGDEPAIHGEELPIEGGRMGPGAIPVGGPQGFYMLNKTPGYSLPFEVWGYYDLRQHRDDGRACGGEFDGDIPAYRPAEPYIREARELVNMLDGERQEIAHTLGTEHPLFKLVDGALHGDDIDELRVAYVAVRGWPRVGSFGALPN